MSKNLRVPFAGFDGEIEQTDDNDKENKGVSGDDFSFLSQLLIS